MTPQQTGIMPLGKVAPAAALGGRAGGDCAHERTSKRAETVAPHAHAEYVSEAEFREFSMIMHRALLAIDTYIQARYNLKRATCPHCGGSLLDREGTL